MKTPTPVRLAVALLAIGICSKAPAADAPAPASAAAKPALVPGEIVAAAVRGEVKLRDAAGVETLLAPGGTFAEGSTLISGADALAMLVLSNGAMVQLQADSEVRIVEFRQAAVPPPEKNYLAMEAEPNQSATNLELKRGAVMCEVKQMNFNAGSTFQVNTPQGSTQVRGTLFMVQHVEFMDGTELASVRALDGVVLLFPSDLAIARAADMHSPLRESIAIPAGSEFIFLRSSLPLAPSGPKLVSWEGRATSFARVQQMYETFLDGPAGVNECLAMAQLPLKKPPPIGEIPVICDLPQIVIQDPFSPWPQRKRLAATERERYMQSFPVGMGPLPLR